MEPSAVQMVRDLGLHRDIPWMPPMHGDITTGTRFGPLNRAQASHWLKAGNGLVDSAPWLIVFFVEMSRHFDLSCWADDVLVNIYPIQQGIQLVVCFQIPPEWEAQLPKGA
jgi:hypothetical protein